MSEQNQILKQFSLRKILIPILLGLIIVGYLLFDDFDPEKFDKLNWSWSATFWIFMSFLMIALRHYAYMYRIKVLIGESFSWWRSFIVILLWEFASAATPSIVGGSTFAVYLLIKEKISAGRSTAIVLFTGFLDELFFMIIAPIGILLAGIYDLFPNDGPMYESPYFYFFVLGYFVLLAYTVFLAYGLFLNPRGLKYIILKIFSLKWLKKWKKRGERIGSDVVETSESLRNQNLLFWVKTFGATMISWSSRFLMVNCMVLAFTAVTLNDQFIIFSRQIVVWVLMLVTPTPGGSGVGEYAFSDFLVEFIPDGYNGPLALLWRLLSYYPYLILGVLMLPRWVRRVYSDD